jgi:probable H4MPT-linked C1 transfer pathway protein
MSLSEVFIGLDVGGANVKAVKLRVRSGSIKIEDIARVYNPLWISGRESLERVLEELKNSFLQTSKSYVVSTCMTAELSDVFEDKQAGVYYVVNTVEKVFQDALHKFYVSTDVMLIDAKTAIQNYLSVAAANWAASAWLLEKIAEERGFRNIVFVDIGSTTTTIIPVVNGKTIVRGRTDPEKLVFGELVYTGALRTNVCAIVDRVPYKGLWARVSSERFALSGDVHLALGFIKSEDYTTETADNRGKSLGEAIARLSRVPCADSKMLTMQEVVEIARYIYEAQVFKVFEALIQIRSWLASIGADLDSFVIMVAGVGKRLALEASERAGFKQFVDVDDVIGEKISPVLPAYAAALMALNRVAVSEVRSS